MTVFQTAIRKQIQAAIDSAQSGIYADVRPALTLDNLQWMIDRAPLHETIPAQLEQIAKDIKRNNRGFRKQGPGRANPPLPRRRVGDKEADEMTITVDGLTIKTTNDKNVLQTIQMRLSKFKPARKPTKREKRQHEKLRNDRLTAAMLSTVMHHESATSKAA